MEAMRGISSRSSPEWGRLCWGLNNLLAIGKYNRLPAPSITGASRQRPARCMATVRGLPTATWFHLGGAADRSVGWHNAQILGMADPINVGKVRYEFYIDGVLGASVANLNPLTYNWLVLGSALSTAPSAIAMDNVNFVMVPEPSTFALGLLGGLGLAAQSHLAAPECLISRSKFSAPRAVKLTAFFVSARHWLWLSGCGRKRHPRCPSSEGLLSLFRQQAPRLGGNSSGKTAS